MSETPVLSIRDLTVAYRSGQRELEAVRDFSLAIHEGQTVGLVGESGSGKSTLALAVMRFLGAEGFIKRGFIRLGERDITDLKADELHEYWGRDVAHVPQNPFTALNPSMRIGEQLAEALRLHSEQAEAAIQGRALELLQRVRLPDPERVLEAYPHQISGGMQQRVMIALALSSEPRLLVMDEPTTALDVTTEAAILDLVLDLAREESTATLYVTHNMGVVAGLTDRVAVIYAGELMEEAPTGALFEKPLHPYTRGLLDSVPRLGQRKSEKALRGIEGQIPSLQELPSACVFAPRCPLATDICWEERPALDLAVEGHRVRCHRWPEIQAGEIKASGEGEQEALLNQAGRLPILEVNGIDVTYPVNRSVVEWLQRKPKQAVQAVRDLDLTAGRSETIGIVGESGSGKSSLARALIGLVERADGEAKLLGEPMAISIGERDLEALSQLQMVFQNPEEALNPYLTVAESLRRPLQRLLGLERGEADQRVTELLELVRLPADYARRLPGQLSGGEKQRVAVARAFASQPEVLLADEAVSALDVSVQAAILNLLAELQIEQGTAMLFIAHDIAVVAYLADRIAVMYLGQIMQLSAADNIFSPPYHPYTEALLSAVPAPDPHVVRQRVPLEGDIPSAIDPPSGCPFHTRCPRYLGDICKDEAPPMQQGEDGLQILCHIPIEELAQEQQPVLLFDEGGKQIQ